MPGRVRTVVEAIATGNPPTHKPQAEAAEWMQRLEGIPERLRARLPQIYANTAIDGRYTALEDYVADDPETFSFYPKNWRLDPAPTTAQRNKVYREVATPLSQSVAADALEKAGLAPEEVTHLVTVSCTGAFAPGLGILLTKHLGLPPTVARTHVGFMGCYAAFNALRVAHGFCQSDPQARVLVVCVELCTLHFQVDDRLETAVVNALFSDGAAAAVLAARSEEEAAGALAYTAPHALLDEDSLDHMTWDLGDTGFLMGLSSKVPAVLARHLPAYLDALLSPHGLTQDDVGFWAIHPGGRAIVEGAQETLGLPDSAVADSLAVLRDYGNMSSPTILFVLRRFLERHREEPFTSGVAMAFGPGLTIEGALFEGV